MEEYLKLWWNIYLSVTPANLTFAKEYLIGHAEENFPK
jgi:hypothetical protein